MQGGSQEEVIGEYGSAITERWTLCHAHNHLLTVQRANARLQPALTGPLMQREVPPQRPVDARLKRFSSSLTRARVDSGGSLDHADGAPCRCLSG